MYRLTLDSFLDVFKSMDLSQSLAMFCLLLILLCFPFLITLLSRSEAAAQLRPTVACLARGFSFLGGVVSVKSLPPEDTSSSDINRTLDPVEPFHVNLIVPRKVQISLLYTKFIYLNHNSEAS